MLYKTVQIYCMEYIFFFQKKFSDRQGQPILTEKEITTIYLKWKNMRKNPRKIESEISTKIIQMVTVIIRIIRTVTMAIRIIRTVTVTIRIIRIGMETIRIIRIGMETIRQMKEIIMMTIKKTTKVTRQGEHINILKQIFKKSIFSATFFINLEQWH